MLKHWAETDAFKEQLRRTEGKREFVFFDGPPFATGLPHYGHLLAGSLKVRPSHAWQSDAIGLHCNRCVSVAKTLNDARLNDRIS